MLKRIDAAIDGITMYRLTLYVLLGLLGVAVALGALGLLPFSPLSMLLSAAFLLIICWAMNTLLAKIPRRADERRVHAHHRADPGAHHRSGAVARRLPVPWLGRDPGDVLEIHSLDSQQAHLQSRRHRRGDHLVRAGRIGELVDRHRRNGAGDAGRQSAHRAQGPPGGDGGVVCRRRAGHDVRRQRGPGPLHPAGGGAAGDRRAAHLRRRCDADRATDSAADAQPEAYLRAADRRPVRATVAHRRALFHARAGAGGGQRLFLAR